MSDIHPKVDPPKVYYLVGDQGSAWKDCDYCHIPTPLFGISQAYVGGFARVVRETHKRVNGKYVDEVKTVKIRTRKRIEVCPACAAEYNQKVLHSKGYPPALDPPETTKTKGFGKFW